MAEIPVKLPLKRVYIGDTYEFLLKDFKDGDGAPIDLEQYSDIRMTIRQRNESGSVAATLTLSSGFVIEGANNDQLRGTISATVTKTFKPGQHIFDIQFTKEGNSDPDIVQTWFKDYLDVEQEVTQ